MSRKKRDWKKNDPVEYFHEYRSHIKSRRQLSREDSGLCYVLRERGKLDEVLPRKGRDWSKLDPVKYFHENYSHVKTRTQLEKEDVGLYDCLRKAGKLDKVLPEKRRNWSKIEPVEYFHENYSHIKSRGKLVKVDSSLYERLRNAGKLDKVLPEKRRNWSKIEPVEYFHEHCSHIKSRVQLQKEDKCLYFVLCKSGRMDEVLPKKVTGRDWSNIDPVEYFRENCLQIKSRGQLKREDLVLFSKLKKIDKLNDILPEKKRDWSKIEPVEYFHEHCSHIKSRGQLHKEDGGLYRVLNERGKLHEIFSEKLEQRDWSKIDPVEYFHKHYSRIKNANRLQKEDSGLYAILYKIGKLDEIFPKKRKHRDLRDWSKINPVKYFYEHYSHVKNRIQLIKEDSGLYTILKNSGKLKEILPKKEIRDWSKTDPVEYFHKHYSHVKNREQLRREDKLLYHILLRIDRLDEVLPSRNQLKKEALETAIADYVK